MMKKRIEITVETSSLVLRRTRHEMPVYCVVCPSPTRLIAPEEAAVLARVSTRTIYRWVETAQLHFTETADGKLFLCPDSLPKFKEKTL